jgi:beta-phosphoglucomutase-like phosphatase (HAD superfamily)
MRRCIIFDLDGTLVKLPIRYDIIQKKLKELFKTESNLSPLIPSIIERSNGNSNMLNNAFELMCAEELIASESLEEIEGVTELIEHLLTKNYTISLVTLQCRKSAETILRKLNLFDKFSSIITRDENHDRFTQIKKTNELLGFDPSNVIVIGDRINDINCATKAGCTSILVNRTDMASKKLSELKNVL